MAEFSELVQALTWLLTNRIQQKIDYIHGLLGDGNGRVRVSTIPGSPEVDYVFVRPDRFSNRTFKVFNKRIEGQDGDPIIIGELPWEPGLVQVVDMDWAAYADVGWGDDVTTTNRHGISHQWRDGAPGIDTFNVYRRQFGDLKTYSTVSGTLNVGVSPYSLDLFGKQYQWPGTQDFSLAGALPTTTGTARMALVFWSPASGTTQGFLGVATGTLGSGAEATILNRPVSPQGVIPSAFVRLAGGQSSITEFDIWDAREPFRPGIFFGTGTAGLSADMIPISDTSGLYTGSTIEAALDQIGFDGARVSKVFESDFGAVALQADATGLIGIGTTSPQTLLDVKGGDDTDGPVFTLSTKDDMTVTANDVIARISFSADDDSASREEVFYIRQVATATWSSSARANYVGFGIMGGGPVFNDDVLVIRNTGNIGIGTIDPGGELHIFEASSGVATPNVNADNLIIESDSNAGISIITTASDRGAVMFGDPDAANQGQFRYDHSTDRFDMVAGAQIRMVIEAAGNVGIGTTDPEGRLHTYDTISGFLTWEFDGLDATVRTIIPNGTGDVLYRLTTMYVLRDSAAAVASGTTDVSNSASVNLTVGGNTVRLRVNADGSTDIARTAGTDTIKVALALRWL